MFSKEAFQEVRRYFRYLHFTTEPEAEMTGDGMKKGTTKRVLRFSFVIPPVSSVRSKHDVRRESGLGFGALLMGC